MNPRILGIIGLSLSIAFVFFRFFQVGLKKQYWIKGGWYRVHMISGTISAWVIPYFFWCLIQNQSVALGVGLGANLALLILSLTALRMLVLIRRTDTRIRRVFVFASLIFIQVALMGIASTLYLKPLGSPLPGRITAGIAMGFGALAIALSLFDLKSHFGSAKNSALEQNEPQSIPRFKPSEILELFSTRSSSQSVLYTNGKKVALFATFSTFIFQAPPCIANWQLMTLPISILQDSGHRSLEWLLTIGGISNGALAWGMFELTLFARHKTRISMSIMTVLCTLVLPLPSFFLFLTIWFGDSWVNALLRSVFLQLQ